MSVNNLATLEYMATCTADNVARSRIRRSGEVPFTCTRPAFLFVLFLLPTSVSGGTGSLRILPEGVFISGGTAFSSLAGPLSSCFSSTAHILPTSDDGGSSAEIRRFFGGPAFGDLRARMVKLAQVGGMGNAEVLSLLTFRLDAADERRAEEQWQGIVSGMDPVWQGLLQTEIGNELLKLLRMFAGLVGGGRDESEDLEDEEKGKFRLSNGSIGNFILVALTLSLGSLAAAINWMCSAAGVPITTLVLPACHDAILQTLGKDSPLDGNQASGPHLGEGPTIHAWLQDGNVIIGQNMISHPPAYPPSLPVVVARGKLRRVHSVEKELSGGDAYPLPSPIVQLLYAPPTPAANPEVIERLRAARVVIYGPGSLYTSILPSVVLPGIGEAVEAMHNGGIKVLMLNAGPDRETGGMTALDHVKAIASGLNRYGELNLALNRLVSHVFVPPGCRIRVDEAELASAGVRVVACPCMCGSKTGHRWGYYCDEGALEALHVLMLGQE